MLKAAGYRSSFSKVTATGSISGASSTGAFTYGALTYTDTNNLAVLQTSVNSYAQVIAQNSSNGTGASADFIVNNDVSTATTFYGNFGINSSTFVGSGSLNLPSASYITSTSGDLVLGTTTANAIHFVANGAATDAASVNSSNKFLVAGSPPLAGMFGTGADGNVTISSGTTTLTRNMCYNNLTLSGTANLNVNGWYVFVAGTLDLSAAPAGAITSPTANGGNASGATGGAGIGGPGNTFIGALPHSNFNSSSGPTATTGAGSNGVNSGVGMNYGGGGGASGAGGAGTLAGGNAVATNNAQANAPGIVTVLTSLPLWQGITNASLSAGATGGSGAAGGGDGVNTGGGGGGAPIGGNAVAVYANIIARGSNVTAALFQSKGSIGGNGGSSAAGNTGGGGGAGGGGGGFIYVVAGSVTGSAITNALDVSGGLGGTGGNGLGTGKGGNGGAGGNGGRYEYLVLNPASYVINTQNTAGTAGGTTVTVTGAAGGAGATSQGNL